MRCRERRYRTTADDLDSVDAIDSANHAIHLIQCSRCSNCTTAKHAIQSFLMADYASMLVLQLYIIQLLTLPIAAAGHRETDLVMSHIRSRCCVHVRVWRPNR
jgi:hypothetical protein